MCDWLRSRTDLYLTVYPQRLIDDALILIRQQLRVTMEIVTRSCCLFVYNGSKPGVQEYIADMTMNGSGVRDTGRVLKMYYLHV